ncbi:hypothetical protein D5R81_13705 [Parashewanella spongiae]|uniref:AlgX/AlgJ SGNH hydrolase-like domain-containing protein n=1 Tax=Parashewanella spongiae TaxID=342950 RepID=A0A3A6TSL9_9GAMM|nr:hypothetical protein [Parashewanella spongiae]MCL1079024.1 hypothetical protein [Parashewanella spongiae]RJY10957.1 hypothetical protein D5R81_13705 [Parashewanella spongiae]
MYRKINTYGFIGLMLTFTILSHLNWQTINIDPKLNWINGQQFYNIEQQYDQAFSAHQFALNFWTAVNFVVFNEGQSGVVIGKNGWLFTAEEFDNTPQHALEIQNRLNTITNTQAQLQQQGIQIIVVVLPSKARVYSEYLTKPLPKFAKSRYQYFTDWLSQHQVPNISLLPVLNQQNSQETFVKNDTHWSPVGAKLSARYIAAELKNRFNDLNWHSHRFITKTLEGKPYRGDLLNYLPLEPYFSFLGGQISALNQERTQSMDEIGLFDDIEYPVAIVGTSYSAKPEWNFVGALQQYSGLNILDMSQNGKGPFMPMAEFIKSEELKRHPLKLVIWEIPERYIVISPEKPKEGSI